MAPIISHNPWHQQIKTVADSSVFEASPVCPPGMEIAVNATLAGI
jgi:hypothetical protein